MPGSAPWATGRLHGVPVPRTKRIVSDAARDGDEVAVLELLRMGSDPNSRCPRDGFTPLIAAVYLRHWGIIEMLLAHPMIDVNRVGSHGNTPLHIACSEHPDAASGGIVARLLQAPGCDRYLYNDRWVAQFWVPRGIPFPSTFSPPCNRNLSLSFSGERAYDVAFKHGFSDACLLLRNDPAQCSAPLLAAQVCVRFRMAFKRAEILLYVLQRAGILLYGVSVWRLTSSATPRHFAIGPCGGGRLPCSARGDPQWTIPPPSSASLFRRCKPPSADGGRRRHIGRGTSSDHGGCAATTHSCCQSSKSWQ